MANEQLLAAANGDADVSIRISLKDQSFGDGGDRVPPGRYSLKIEKASWESKKDKAGKNLKIVYSVNGPEGGEWIGARVVQYMSAPTGDAKSDDFAKAMRMVQNLAASVFSARGMLDQARASDGFDFSPSGITGATCFAFLDDDEYNGVVKSKVVFHLPLEDYTKASGPDANAAARKAVGSAAPAPRVAPATTGATPNLLGGVQTAQAAAPATPPAQTPAPAPANGDAAARMLGLS